MSEDRTRPADGTAPTGREDAPEEPADRNPAADPETVADPGTAPDREIVADHETVAEAVDDAPPDLSLPGIDAVHLPVEPEVARAGAVVLRVRS